MIERDKLRTTTLESLSILDEVRGIVRREDYVWSSDEGRKVTHLLELAQQYTALVGVAAKLQQETNQAHALRTGGKR